MKSFDKKTIKACSIKSIKGFSLAEILVSVVVITVALVPLITVLGQGVKRGKDPQRITVAQMLAQDLMEEIMCKKFDEDPTNPDTTARLGPDSLETRPGNPTNRNYDDVDDYDGYTDGWTLADPLIPPKEVDGTEMTEYINYFRSVVVDYVSETNLDLISTSITRFKRVTVTVSWAYKENGTQKTLQLAQLRAIKGNY
jgi:MSHA pilin protein MshD